MIKNDGTQESTTTQATRFFSALEKTYVIVVTFNPDLEVLKAQFTRLTEENVKVVVVDNHSMSRNDISNLASEHAFEVICLSANKGIAVAHNAGIEYVRSKGGKYLIILDQDSIPERHAFVALVESFFSFDPSQKTGAVGSSYTLQEGHKGSSFVRFGWFHFNKIFCDLASTTLHEVDFLISSGTFIPVSVIDDVGMMREELFIDHVDTEWFLRAKYKGYRFFGCCSARLTHALGERTVRVWFGRWRTVPVHKGFRYFYTFRNSMWLYRQKYAPGKWISADVMRLVYIFMFSSLFVSPRSDNIKWMFKGLRAGLKDIKHWSTTEVTRQAQDVG
ncbi:MAG: glycosyltransferase family 2 protein [Arenicellales bacterium]|nr:glycosyltransferase family 2 protein [Arenicellales bacterium]